jgi:HK97 family phage major capsid protein
MSLMLKQAEPRMEYRSMPSDLEHKNNLMQEAEMLVNKAKKERRALSTSEQNRFNSITKEIEALTEKLKSNSADSFEVRAKKTGETVKSPLEVRGYKKSENIGNGSEVTIGDLIVGYTTGKFRNEEAKRALSTTSGGLSIPTEVYKDFIDRLRNQSFLGECVVYPMNSQTLLVPRVTGDPVPHFKIENDLGVESPPIFDSTVLQARPLYCYTSISLELLESSNLEVGEVVSRIMVGAMQSAMQTFMLSGAVNGYAGILNDPNLTKIAATDITYASIGAGVQAVLNNNGQPNGIVLSADSLMGLELAADTTGQFITPPAFYQNLNKFVVGDDIGGDVLVGDLSSIAWGVLSEGGLQIEVDRFGEAFQRGQLRIRARINGDFALTNPKLLALIDTP